VPESDYVVGQTHRVPTGCGNLYATINADEEEDAPTQVLCNISKAGGCVSAFGEVIARLVTIALEYDVPPERLIKTLRGISCRQPAWGEGGKKVSSCADALGRALETFCEEYDLIDEDEVDDEETAANGGFSDTMTGPGACPECGASLRHESGCVECSAQCGYSKCG